MTRVKTVPANAAPWAPVGGLRQGAHGAAFVCAVHTWVETSMSLNFGIKKTLK
jgi:hypothetical protein